MSSSTFFSSLSLRGRSKNSPRRLRNEQQAQLPPLSSRASSATLYTEPSNRGRLMKSFKFPDNAGDATADSLDVSVTRGLLEGSAAELYLLAERSNGDVDLVRVPRRSSSFSALPRLSNENCRAGQSRDVRAEKERWDHYVERDSSARPLLTAADSMPSGFDGGVSFSAPGIGRRNQGRSSNTWSSSDDLNFELEDKEDREPFVQEFNRLAKQYSVPIIVPEGFDSVATNKVILEGPAGSWLMRKILKRTSSVQVAVKKAPRSMRHKRSVSDITTQLKSLKRDALKNKDLDELVRLCGYNPLWLPGEYSTCTLHVPSCFRATGQFLVQHAKSRGIFRIPGSKATVEALYNHYAVQDGDEGIISGTIRSPQLPEHIKFDVFDIASTFKRFLSGLPRGILGSTWLFDAMVHIYGLLDSDPETTRTKQSKVRARLIALAIACVQSRYERELICAVFGLLCMIGRTAETARREDSQGRPLPTSDLMGYQSLGVIFGPLLIGALLDEHVVQTPPHLSKDGQSHTSSRSPPKSSWRSRRKHRSADDTCDLLIRNEKYRLANAVAEMLIVHWRDVVRQMRNLGALKSVREYEVMTQIKRALKPSQSMHALSEIMGIRKPKNWDEMTLASAVDRERDQSHSPTPRPRRTSNPLREAASSPLMADHLTDTLSVKKQRNKVRPMTSQMMSGKSMSILTPTAEERATEEEHGYLDAYMRLPSKSTMDDRFQSSRSPRVGNRVHVFEAGSHSVGKGSTMFLTSSTSEMKPDQLKVSERASSKALDTNQYENEDYKTYDVPIVFESDRYNAMGDPIIDKGKQREDGTARAVTMDWNSVVGPGIKSIPGTSHSQKSEKEIEQHQFLSATSYQPENKQLPRRLSPSVPRGIVSSRVRGLATTDPEVQDSSSSSFRTANEGNASAKKRARTGDESSAGLKADVSIPVAKDPIARVSRNDDEKSLASLAEVIGSEDSANKVCSPPRNRNAPSSTPTNDQIVQPQIVKKHSSSGENRKTKIRKPAPSTTSCGSSSKIPKVADDTTPKAGSEPLRVDSPRNNMLTYSSSKRAAAISSPEKLALKQPSTPRRPFTDPATIIMPSSVRSTASKGSVRALAARFNTVDANSQPSPSPTRQPASRRLVQPEHSSSKQIASPYTINEAPERSRRSSRSARSDRSLPSLHSPGTTTPRPMSRRGNGVILTPTRQAVNGAFSKQGEFSTPTRVASKGTKQPRREVPVEYAHIITPNLSSDVPGGDVPTQWPKLRSIGSLRELREQNIARKNGQEAQPKYDGSQSPQRSTQVQPSPAFAIPSHLMLNNGEDYTISTVTTRATSTLPSALQRPSSMTNMRLNLGTVLPVQYDEPKVDGYVQFSRPATAMTGRAESATPSWISSWQVSSAVEEEGQHNASGGHRRKNSQLYSEVLSLKRKLEEKNEEIEALKRRLDARGGVDGVRDLGSLSEEVRILRRDVKIWKKRAESAEKRVAVLEVLIRSRDVVVDGSILAVENVLEDKPQSDLEDQKNTFDSAGKRLSAEFQNIKRSLSKKESSVGNFHLRQRSGSSFTGTEDVDRVNERIKLALARHSSLRDSSGRLKATRSKDLTSQDVKGSNDTTTGTVRRTRPDSLAVAGGIGTDSSNGKMSASVSGSDGSRNEMWTPVEGSFDDEAKDIIMRGKMVENGDETWNIFEDGDASENKENIPPQEEGGKEWNSVIDME